MCIVSPQQKSEAVTDDDIKSGANKNDQLGFVNSDEYIYKCFSNKHIPPFGPC